MKKLQFTFNSSGSVGAQLIVRSLLRVGWCSFLCALLLCVSAYASLAQAPGWSRGQQNLALTYDECVRRMPQALQAEGYRRDDQPGGNFAIGIKGVHMAAIICSPAPDARMLVQIVVASNGDGGGIERQRLQAQMEQPGSGQRPASCGGADFFFNTTFEWLDNGRSLGAVNFLRDGRAQVTWINVPHVWRTDSNGDLMVYGDGTRWVIRLRFDPAACAFSGTRDRTSQTQDGVQTVVRPFRR